MSLGHITDGARRSAGGAPPCTYEVDLHFDRDHSLINHEAVPHNAIFYWAHCDEMSYLRWYVPGAGADPVAAGQLTELIQEAFDRIEAIGPTLTLSPGLDHYQLTGMPTFLAIDPVAWNDPPTGSVTAGSITVTAWLEPVEVTWDLGTGDVQACQGPGNTYADGVPLREQTIDCPYVFTTHPADHFGSADATGYDIAATVTYLANYRVEGFPPGGPAIEATLGPIDGPTATGHQEVREMRAVLTTNQD